MRRIRRPLIALVALLAALVVGYVVQAASSDDSDPRPTTSVSAPRSGDVALSDLPAQAQATITLIRRGGPFPYPGPDGAVFGNREHHLPARASGYYREYTVPTPGSDDRGVRRIVAGRDGEFFYSDDHYASFRRVDVSR